MTDQLHSLAVPIESQYENHRGNRFVSWGGGEPTKMGARVETNSMLNRVPSAENLLEVSLISKKASERQTQIEPHRLADTVQQSHKLSLCRP